MSMLNISRRKGPACISKFADDMGPKLENKEWMKAFDDEKPLNKISIPGTHQSMSFKCDGVGNHWAWCQCFDLRYQLDMGVRFVDVRCRHADGEMKIYHGKYSLGATVFDVLQILRDYLEEFPSETIILSLGHEMQEKDKSENWVQEFIEYMESSVLSTERVWRDARVPLLGEVRGKIIVLANYPCYPTKQLSWGENMKFENTVKPDGFDNKWELVDRQLTLAYNEPADSNTWYLTMCSYSDNEFPVNSADKMNEKLLPWLREHYGQYPNGAGILVVDYPGFEIIQDIIHLSSTDPWLCPVGWEKPTGLILLPAIACNTPHGEIPGKTLPGGKQCWYGYDGKEVATSDFKVVGGDVKPLATDLGGAQTKIGIALTSYGYTPCKVADNGKECWYTFDGKEYKQKSNFYTINYPGA